MAVAPNQTNSETLVPEATRPGPESHSAEHDGDCGSGYLTIVQAAKIAPGRPNVNAVWRWCRKGVRARSGDRVRLRHIRVGNRLFTTETWLREFGRLLAEADARYFDKREEDGDVTQAEPSVPSHPFHLESPEEINRLLEQEGL